VIAQRVQQGDARFEFQPPILAVDVQRERDRVGPDGWPLPLSGLRFAELRQRPGDQGTGPDSLQELAAGKTLALRHGDASSC